MGARPLVSIMMPCFEAEQTLPMALASMRAQTYPNWEAVIVDDGSTDRTWEILQSADDPRMRVERFETNRGRGAARQRCLEMAQGDFLSFLDSDDWLFPNKLEFQLQIMRNRPEVAALSGACVITDARRCAVGLTSAGLRRGSQITVGRFRRPGPPPFSFPPCMIRMEAARRGRFNPAFRRSQDSDFLIQVLLGKIYAVSAAPVYAYSQADAASLEKTLEGYRYRIRSYQQQRFAHPWTVRLQIAKTLARIGIYQGAALLRAEDALIRQRWKALTEEAVEAYAASKRSVERHLTAHDAAESISYGLKGRG